MIIIAINDFKVHIPKLPKLRSPGREIQHRHAVARCDRDYKQVPDKMSVLHALIQNKEDHA